MWSRERFIAEATVRPVLSSASTAPASRTSWPRASCSDAKKELLPAPSRAPARFEQANRGTIFLDEVGELSMKIPPKLLDVTETLDVDRIGGRKPIPVDFRLIVATNRNLEEMVRQGKLRDDLYDRLNVVSICVPPLRERMDNIPLLVDYFISDCAGQARRMVTGAAPQVLDLFQQYSWPGNIREPAEYCEALRLYRQNR